MDEFFQIVLDPLCVLSKLDCLHDLTRIENVMLSHLLTTVADHNVLGMIPYLYLFLFSGRYHFLYFGIASVSTKPTVKDSSTIAFIAIYENLPRRQEMFVGRCLTR